MEQQTPTTPKVFISYTHDSEEHRRRVLELAERLRSSWVDAWIDQYVEDRAAEWPEWTERQIREGSLRDLFTRPRCPLR